MGNCIEKPAMTARIAAELHRRFLEAGLGNSIHITMKSDGNRLTLTSCSMDDKTIEFVLVHGKGPALWMEGTLDQTAAAIADYDRLCAEYREAELKLKAFAETNRNEPYDGEQFQFYSDWHKSLYGCRPASWDIWTIDDTGKHIVR